MTMTSCPECGQSISTDVAQCPHCGCNVICCPECGYADTGEKEQCAECGFVFKKKEEDIPSYYGVSKEAIDAANQADEEKNDPILSRWSKTNSLNEIICWHYGHIKTLCFWVGILLMVIPIFRIYNYDAGSSTMDSLDALISLPEFFESCKTMFTYGFVLLAASFLVVPIAHFYIKYSFSSWLIQNRVDCLPSVEKYLRQWKNNVTGSRVAIHDGIASLKLFMTQQLNIEEKTDIYLCAIMLKGNSRVNSLIKTNYIVKMLGVVATAYFVWQGIEINLQAFAAMFLLGQGKEFELVLWPWLGLALAFFFVSFIYTVLRNSKKLRYYKREFVKKYIPSDTFYEILPL